jgi:hypothetical protein
VHRSKRSLRLHCTECLRLYVISATPPPACVRSGVCVCIFAYYQPGFERQATGNPLIKRSALSSGEKAVEHRSGAQTGGERSLQSLLKVCVG